MSYELRLFKQFLTSGQCVFSVRCGLRLKTQLRTVLFCVIMQYVVVISYQISGELIGPILTPKEGTNRLS
jgi:hypothetical protein